MNMSESAAESQHSKLQKSRSDTRKSQKVMDSLRETSKKLDPADAEKIRKSLPADLTAINAQQAN